MIYTIKYNDNIISSSLGDLMQIHYNAKLSLQKNNAGKLSFSYPSDHVSYDVPQPMDGVISVERDGKEIFFGRVLSYTTAKDLVRSFECEGALAFFSDISLEHTSASALSLANLMSYVRSNSGWEFYAASTISSLPITEDMKTVFDVLSNYIKSHGGSFRCYRNNGTMYIAYSGESLGISEQGIRLGDNLIDISVTVNPDYAMSDFKTKIEVKAFDKSYADSSYAPFKLGYTAEVISEPHGVDEFIEVEQMEIDLNNAAATVISLGVTTSSLTNTIATANRR